MKATQQYKLLNWDDVKIDVIQRQRQEDRGEDGLLDVSDLLESVRRNGILQPVIVDENNELKAGERRWTCAKLLNIKLPVRYFKDLSAVEAQLIELEENHKRKGLHWRDEVRSISRLHELYMELHGSDWSQADTARELDISPSLISQYLRVMRDLGSDRIASVESARAAYNVLARLDERKMGDALSDIVAMGQDLFESAAPVAAAIPATPTADGRLAEAASHPDYNTYMNETMPVPQVSRPSSPPVLDPFLNQSFLDWAPQYSGQPFNFIHCDFPYGINFNKGAMSGKNSWETYNDSPDIYWDLCKCLAENLDRVMAHSAHLMFWLAGDINIMHATLEFFRQNAPDLEFNPYPLIWHKTDNAGILPDPKRGPRRVYEVALMAAREDRQIVKAVSNTYGAPTNKDHHPSTKPEPMLKHFFQMFVDENTRLLDPTCGGGSSLRAADAMGAKEVLGLEISPEHFTNAQSAFRSARALRNITR